MITLLALGYVYTVWLFTGRNALPHLNPDFGLLAIPELLIEAFLVIDIYLLIQKFVR